MESFLVRPACSRTVKSTLTYATLVRPIVRVDVHVHLEGTTLAKRPSALIAMVLPNVGVRQLVVLKRFRKLKRQPAHVAVVRSNITVFLTFMIAHLAFTDKRVRALIALVRLLAQMSAHVNFALAGTEKASITRLEQTRKRFVSGVEFHVLLEIAHLRHSDTAGFAAKRFQLGLAVYWFRMETVHVIDDFMSPECGVIANFADQSCIIRISNGNIVEQETCEESCLCFGFCSGHVTRSPPCSRFGRG